MATSKPGSEGEAIEREGLTKVLARAYGKKGRELVVSSTALLCASFIAEKPLHTAFPANLGEGRAAQLWRESRVSSRPAW